MTLRNLLTYVATGFLLLAVALAGPAMGELAEPATPSDGADAQLVICGHLPNDPGAEVSCIVTCIIRIISGSVCII